MHYFKNRPELLDLTQYIEYEPEAWGLKYHEGWEPKQYVQESFKEDGDYVPWLDDDEASLNPINDHLIVANDTIREISLAALLELPHWVIQALEIKCFGWHKRELYPHNFEPTLTEATSRYIHAKPYEQNYILFKLALVRIPHILEEFQHRAWPLLTGAPFKASIKTNLYNEILTCYNANLMLAIRDYTDINGLDLNDFKYLWDGVAELRGHPIPKFPTGLWDWMLGLHPMRFVEVLEFQHDPKLISVADTAICGVNLDFLTYGKWEYDSWGDVVDRIMAEVRKS